MSALVVGLLHIHLQELHFHKRSLTPGIDDVGEFHPRNWFCCSPVQKMELDKLLYDKTHTANLLPAFDYGIDMPIRPHHYETLAGSFVEAFVSLQCCKDKEGKWRFSCELVRLNHLCCTGYNPTSYVLQKNVTFLDY